uniref:von Willebrand factor A domain-containing protein 5A n=1 Tax=Fundulus heteroclitus TaxID=8078 RepID=A0A3Q2TWN7_FUNHE
SRKEDCSVRHCFPKQHQEDRAYESHEMPKAQTGNRQVEESQGLSCAKGQLNSTHFINIPSIYNRCTLKALQSSLMGDPVVMVSLYPEFPQDVMSSLASCGEFVFLMDRSGSMGCSMNDSTPQETRISSARDTLVLLLKSLPMGCYFNIYSFGSEFEHIFPTSVEYSEKTMEEALKKVENMEANFGGTEILLPLKHIYSQSCIPKQPRQLFIFTDGEVGNTKEVTDLVKMNAALLSSTGWPKREEVMQSLRFALQPAVEDISVSWDLPKGVSSTILSPPITAMFQGQRSLIYAQLAGQTSDATDGSVTVKYSLAGHPSQNQLHFNLKPAEDTGLTIHRLVARTVIRSQESEQRTHSGQQDEEVMMKKKVVELSVQSGVSSSFTAFIAVNKDDGKAVQGPLVRRNIPTAFYGSDLSRPWIWLLSVVSLSDTSSQIRLYFSLYVTGPVVTHEAASPPPHKDPLLQLVSLQKASGCWLLDAHLAAALGKTSEEVEKAKPASVNGEVWASILALIWLHGFKMDAKEEWELLTLKAASWIKAQNAPCVSECVEAGNTLLGCSVKKEDLGL